MSSKKYDIVLFGVTGFTGKLCAEYLMENYADVKWAASARNESKANEVLNDISQKTGKGKPDLLIANLLCSTKEQEMALREIVSSTKVCLTCSGPFEKYGQTLVKLCAEEGVCYGDITGETDFVRKMIKQHDGKARETGAVIISHCGNDCVPQDLLVHEMHRFCKQQNPNAELSRVMTYGEHAGEASLSGGTITTATFQMGKDRKTMAKDDFDPIVTSEDGTKSEYILKNVSPKSFIPVPGAKDKKAGPWFMAPVFVSCVRRSNALLQYSKNFEYGDCLVSDDSWEGWIHRLRVQTVVGAAVALPTLFGSFAPQPGEGPDRETMEAGYATIHGHGTANVPGDDTNKTIEVSGKFQFNKDIAYLYTAAFLVEVGMLLKDKSGYLAGGVKTPASALGNDLTQRLLDKLDCSLDIGQT